jgi:predicted dehydrogenase
MADKVRIGIIGVGQIGKGHLRTYRDIPDAEIVAACDLNEIELARVAAEFDIPDTYTDYHDLLAHDDIQSVDVCLHNQLHRPVTIDALEAGKNVYCEKPISWTYHDGRAMVQAAQDTGRLLHVQLGRIYRPDTVGAKRLIDEGHLGDLYAATTLHYRRRGRPYVDGYGSTAFVKTATAGGGALIDYGIYNISRMLYLLDNPGVLSVSASTYDKLDMYQERRDESGYDVEELAMGFVRMEGGITYTLAEAWAVHSDQPEQARIYGTKGGIQVEPLTYHTTLADIEMDATFDVERALWRWNKRDPSMKYRFSSDLPFHQMSQHHWIAAQLGYVELLDTARIALGTALISEGVYLSSHSGREVTMEEIEAAAPGEGRRFDAAN